jgi:hypothetical protein
MSISAKVAQPGTRLRRWASPDALALGVIIGFCLLATGLAAIGPLANLFTHRSIDYGEGWNAYWAAAAMRGPTHLYSSTHALVANNYPPLSFYICGFLGKLIGDNVFAGRIIATVSVVAVAIMIGHIVRRSGAPVLWGVASAALFLAYDVLYFSQFIGVNNPQWLGQAVMLAGVLPLMRAGPLSKSRIVLAAAIMILAGLVKHNQLALPLAVTIWLGWKERRSLGIWLVSACAWGAVACAVLLMIFGPAIFVELLTFKRTTDMANFSDGIRKVGCLAGLLAVALISFPAYAKERNWSLFALYGFLGLILGALQRLGSGVYVNAHFDALIALVVLAGISLGAPSSHSRALGPLSRTLLLIPLVIPLALVATSHAKRSIRELRDRSQAEKGWDAIIADVRDARGPVLCEVPVVCYWAGKPFSLDFFAYGQKLRTGTSPTPLLGFIGRRRAALLILDPGYDRQSNEGRLPAPFPMLMRERYVAVRTLPGSIEERVPRAD